MGVHVRFQMAWPYLMFFQYRLEDGSMGRLINDEHRAPNSTIQLIEINGRPNLCIFATKDILPGTEMTYNYGGKDLQWCKEVQERVTAVTGTPESTECLGGGHMMVLDTLPQQTTSNKLTVDFPNSEVLSPAIAHQGGVGDSPGKAKEAMQENEASPPSSQGGVGDWCQLNHLLINSGKSKEMVVDFRPSPPPVNIQGMDIERVL